MFDMITAGAQTKLAVQWAAELAPNPLLISYKNALVYIDQRGWFNNTFETEAVLEGEVQRVLDVRVAFGEEPEWTEFPYPKAWADYKPPGLDEDEPDEDEPDKPTLSPSTSSRLRVRKRKPKPEPPLVTEIGRNEKAYRNAAIHYLQTAATSSYSDQQTVCLMWDAKGELRKAATGGKKCDPTTLRKQCGVPTWKETVCAEEVFLTKFSKSTWIVSASYDCRNGWKGACKAGCRTILNRLKIIDVGYKLRMIAERDGVKSWSTKEK